MSNASLGLAFAAGALSTLSPCVLPLIPIVLGSAASEHRLGPAALASGLAISFAAIGLFVATIGFSIGLDASVLRTAAALLIVLFGVVLAVPRLQEQLAVAAGPVTGWAGNRLSATKGEGLGGQFAVGALLGAVWSPCAGPTLGAASVLASQGENLGMVATTMLVFGIGAAAPLLTLGMLSREAMLKMRNRMMAAGYGLRTGLGVTLAVLGVAILSGQDKHVETWLVEHSPVWLTTLTTSI